MLYLNDVPVDVTRFPDMTSQVWKLPNLANINFAKITWKFGNEGEIAHLGQLKMLLQSYGTRASLYLPYLPYGRQDKEISNSSTFALKTFAHFINAMSFEEVTILDPHSERALELIRCSRAIYPTDQVTDIIKLTKSDILCYPDNGALSKYIDIYSFGFIYGEKVRDQSTGNILSYKLVGDCAGKNVLIVDDIADGGATFKLLAKDLLAAGAKEVNLFVTHGIFSKGLRTLTDSGIKRIFTQDGEASTYQDQIMYRRLS
jgi:ribose-phosphate pyrophosphokinase